MIFKASIMIVDKPISIQSLTFQLKISYQCYSKSTLFLGRFGSRYRSNVTGIIYNDEMDDFDIPGHNIVDGISPSPFNFPEPNKRPFSSISPTILTNEDGTVQLVIGAPGGKRITIAVSLVCLMTLELMLYAEEHGILTGIIGRFLSVLYGKLSLTFDSRLISKL